MKKILIIAMILLLPAAFASANAIIYASYGKPCGMVASGLELQDDNTFGLTDTSGSIAIYNKYCVVEVYAKDVTEFQAKMKLINPMWVIEIKYLENGIWTPVPREIWLVRVQMKEFIVDSKRLAFWDYGIDPKP